MRHVIAYDISPDEVRLRVARVLEEFGDRVQESVFEVDLEPDRMAVLTKRLTGALAAPENGQVRFYRLCRDCHQASFGLGEVVPRAAAPAIVIG